MRGLPVDRDLAIGDQLLHVAARTDARLCEHLVQLGRVGHRRQHALGRLGIGLRRRLAVIGAGHHIGEALADIDRRPFGRGHFVAGGLHALFVSLVVVGVVVEAVCAFARIHHHLARRSTITAVAAAAPTIAIAPALLVTAWRSRCGLAGVRRSGLRRLRRRGRRVTGRGLRVRWRG